MGVGGGRGACGFLRNSQFPGSTVSSLELQVRLQPGEDLGSRRVGVGVGPVGRCLGEGAAARTGHRTDAGLR